MTASVFRSTSMRLLTEHCGPSPLPISYGQSISGAYIYMYVYIYVRIETYVDMDDVIN